MAEDEKQRCILEESLKEKNVAFLTKFYFDIDLTPLQTELVKKIVFEEHKKFSISAMTRWGKSLCVAISVALYFILNKDKTIIFLAPTEQQSMILRDYLAKLIRDCPSLLEIVDLSSVAEERLITQTSKAYQTFKNGCSYRVFTCHDKGENLMGHGLGSEGGILIVDEACQISNEAYTKILRMLGDNIEKSILIELYNPWTRSCKAFEHSNDPDFYKIHVGYLDAIQDGRTTLEFIESQRKEITPLEFTVLYESEFPLESEDSIFNLAKIKMAYRDPLTNGTLIISCDVADKGMDKTVIITGYKLDNNMSAVNIYSESKSENVAVAGRIIDIIKRNHPNRMVVNIDCIGVGVGVLSMVKEFASPHRNITVVGCHNGESPILNPERFLNKKAENYFRLKELFDQGLITIPDHKELVNQLISMRWEFTSASKIRVIDPDKSPDFADALVYFVWYSKPEYRPYISI